MVVHDFADRVGEGNVPRRVMGSTIGARLGKASFPVRSASWMEVGVPALAVRADGICGLGCGAALEVVERNRIALGQQG